MFGIMCSMLAGHIACGGGTVVSVCNIERGNFFKCVCQKSNILRVINYPQGVFNMVVSGKFIHGEFGGYFGYFCADLFVIRVR